MRYSVLEEEKLKIKKGKTQHVHLTEADEEVIVGFIREHRQLCNKK